MASGILQVLSMGRRGRAGAGSWKEDGGPDPRAFNLSAADGLIF